jgi:signal peptidase I
MKKEDKTAKKPVTKSKSREYLEAIIIAIILALLIRAFVVQAFKIPSGSMIPTLVIGDHILVNKFIYGLKVPFTDGRFLIFSPPKRGDIIVFSYPGNRDIEECTSFSKNISARFSNAFNMKNPLHLFKNDCRDFIKRIIAVGGDTIEIKDKTVNVNGRAVSEPYKQHSDNMILGSDVNERDNFGPITIPRNKFFVMGDNRDNSHDSRFWKFVDISEIKGEAFIVYWSWDSLENLINKVRWSRIGMALD